MTDTQLQFLRAVYEAASNAHHIWPAMAACEAALESSWGQSRLAREAKNLFGLKVPSSWSGPTISMPTQEFLHGEWVTVPAKWPVFADYAESMAERIRVLHANSSYAAAIAAVTAEGYIDAVSPVWATDPDRAAKVLAIYRKHGSQIVPVREIA